MISFSQIEILDACPHFNPEFSIDIDHGSITITWTWPVEGGRARYARAFSMVELNTTRMPARFLLEDCTRRMEQISN